MRLGCCRTQLSIPRERVCLYSEVPARALPLPTFSSARRFLIASAGTTTRVRSPQTERLSAPVAQAGVARGDRRRLESRAWARLTVPGRSPRRAKPLVAGVRHCDPNAYSLRPPRDAIMAVASSMPIVMASRPAADARPKIAAPALRGRRSPRQFEEPDPRILGEPACILPFRAIWVSDGDRTRDNRSHNPVLYH